jgi:DNA-damage-inducible protein J
MTTQINIKIEKDLKRDVDIIFNKLGLSATDAVRIFFKKVQAEMGIPFKLKIDYEPNEETKKALLSDDLIQLNSIEEVWDQYEND